MSDSSDDQTTENRWSSDIESILENIRSNAANLAEHHKQSFLSIQARLIFFKIPVINLSGFNSIFSIGLSNFLNQNIVSVINFLLSLICGIVVSIELYLTLQKRSDQELTSYKDFYLLGVKIAAMIKLDRDHRTVDGKEFLQTIISEYTSLFEISNIDILRMDDKIMELQTGNIMLLPQHKIDIKTDI